MNQFDTDPRQIAYLEIDSLVDDTKRLMMRASWGQTDRYSEGRPVATPGAGSDGKIPITGHRIRTFVDKDKNTMTTYYFDHLWTTWRKSTYHFPPGTTYAKAGAITFNSNNAWWTHYKSFRRFVPLPVTVITIS